MFRAEELEVQKQTTSEMIQPLTSTVTILSDPVQQKSHDDRDQIEERNLQMRWSESSSCRADGDNDDDDDAADINDDDDEDSANIICVASDSNE